MKTLILTLLCMAGASRAFSQSFAIDWFTIDGGGGTSTGGVFSVSGTIGQTDSGTMTNGNFTLQGGFWSVTLVQLTNGPALNIRRNGTGSVVIAWPYPSTGFVLQEATALLAGDLEWSNVLTPPAHVVDENVITNSSPSGIRFYRLKQP